MSFKARIATNIVDVVVVVVVVRVITKDEMIQQIFVVIILTIHNVVNLSETDTQLMMTDSIIPESQLSISPTIRLMNNNIQQDAIRRFKLSPTRIRISSNNNNANKIYNQRETITSDNREMTAIDVAKLTATNQQSKLNPVIDLTNLKRNFQDQMAPAYELWPDVNREDNLVKFKRLTVFKGSSLLPSPLRTPQSSRRSIRVRSVSASREDNVNTRGNSTGDDYDQSDDSAEPDSNDEQDGDQVERSDDDGSNVVENAREGDVKYKTSYMEPVLESKAEPRKLSKSPVYPPGDVDILYSDALLVYVKDFNQFIKRR